MAEVNQFQPGDVVRLKSGGPSMTVGIPLDVNSKFPMANVSWFDVKMGMHREIVPVSVLEAVDSPPRVPQVDVGVVDAAVMSERQRCVRITEGVCLHLATLNNIDASQGLLRERNNGGIAAAKSIFDGIQSGANA